MSFLKRHAWIKTGLFFLIVFIAANLWSTRNHKSGVAPEFSLTNLQNESRLFQFKQNEQPVLLHFFATWCPICKLENDSLISIAKDHPIIMVAMQSGEVEDILQYQQEHQLPMTIYNDHDGTVSALYGVKGVPTSFIINQHGTITSSTMGYATEIGLRMRLWFSQF